MQFAMKFVHLHPYTVQRAAPRCSDGIHPSPAAIDLPKLRFQQSAALHAVQQWVERSRADAVTMANEFFHHSQAKDGLVQRVHQHVDPDEPGKQVTLPSRFSQWPSRVSHYVISNFDAMIRFSQ